MTTDHESRELDIRDVVQALLRGQNRKPQDGPNTVVLDGSDTGLKAKVTIRLKDRVPGDPTTTNTWTIEACEFVITNTDPNYRMQETGRHPHSYDVVRAKKCTVCGESGCYVVGC